VTGDHSRALFNEVVMPHLDDSYSLARWITGSATDAEDVVQDACLRAFRGVEGFSGGNSRAWFLAIVRNTALSWIQRNRPGALVFTGDLEAAERAAPELPGGPTPEAELIAKADAARLESAIAALPLVYRETLVLRDINGLSYREIADVTQLPAGTIMSRLARARASLARTLGRDP
jgi:RNA polymerase sigma factor (sigma-70 family)